MEIVSKIDAQWSRLEEITSMASRQEDSNISAAISRITSSLDQVSICFQRINEGSLKRQELVDLHCVLEVSLTLTEHENYHKINEFLLSDIKTFFLIIKTYLNSLALFIKDIIPQSQLRGLRFKSFGSLVDSAKKTAESNYPNLKLRKLLAKNGDEFEKKFVEYRDKTIEHPGKLTDTSLSSTDGVSRVIHYDRTGNNDNKKSEDNSKKYSDEERIIHTGNHKIWLSHKRGATFG